MAQIQGIKIAGTMVALVVALTTVNALAATSGVAIELSANGVTTEQVEQVNSELNNQDASGVGSQDPGFLGIAIATTQTLKQLVALTTVLGGMLKSWGVPAVIAYSVQIMVDLTMGLAILQVLLRFKY